MTPSPTENQTPASPPRETIGWREYVLARSAGGPAALIAEATDLARRLGRRPREVREEVEAAALRRARADRLVGGR